MRIFFQIMTLGLFFGSAPAYGIWSFGTAVNNGTVGVSLQAQPSYATAIHGAYLFVGRRPAITLDYQLFSDRLGSTRARGYFGGGAEATLADEDKQSEVYSFRLPAGVQYDFLTSTVQLFGEVAGVFGPLPGFDTAAQFTVGARAWF